MAGPEPDSEDDAMVAATASTVTEIVTWTRGRGAVWAVAATLGTLFPAIAVILLMGLASPTPDDWPIIVVTVTAFWIPVWLCVLYAVCAGVVRRAVAFFNETFPLGTRARAVALGVLAGMGGDSWTAERLAHEIYVESPEYPGRMSAPSELPAPASPDGSPEPEADNNQERAQPPPREPKTYDYVPLEPYPEPKGAGSSAPGAEPQGTTSYFHCKCGAKLAVPPGWRGGKGRCPKCRRIRQVPAQPA